MDSFGPVFVHSALEVLPVLQNCDFSRTYVMFLLLCSFSQKFTTDKKENEIEIWNQLGALIPM